MRRLDEMLAVIARCNAASKQIREALSAEGGLAELIAGLQLALDEGVPAGVTEGEITAAQDRLSELQVLKRKDDAVRAMADGVVAADVDRVRAAIFEAKA